VDRWVVGQQPSLASVASFGIRSRLAPCQDLALSRSHQGARHDAQPAGVQLEPYTFDSHDGERSLLDLFDGRRQLIVQHFMYASDTSDICDGCSMMAGHIGPLSHLHARDTSFTLVSRAPLAMLLAFRDPMGWSLPWVSSGRSTFNDDFGVTVDGEERQGISVFLHGDRVFHTWTTYARAEEPFMVVFDLLDLTPYGRQETWEASPPDGHRQPLTRGCDSTIPTERRAEVEPRVASPSPATGARPRTCGDNA